MLSRMATRLSLILTLAGKDWRLFWADRRAALLCFLVPIVLASAFGMIFDRPHQGTGVKLPVLIVTEGDGPFLRQLEADLLASPRMEARLATADEARALITDRRPGVAIVLTQELEKLADWQPMGAQDRPRLGIWHHPLCQTDAQWAEGVATEVVMRSLAKRRLGAMVQDHQLEAPFQADHATVSNSPEAQFNSYSHSFSGMTLQYLLFWGMESGLLFLRERSRGVWLRMRAAPVPLTAMVVGKALATAAIAMLQVGTTFGFGYLVFGVHITGSLWGFLFLSLVVCLLAGATGLMVAAIGGTEARARSVCILVILGVSMLGGLWLPTFLLPGWARDLAMALPTTWAMRGLDLVTWQAGEFSSVLPSIAVVGGFALVFLMLAAARLAAQERQRRQGNSSL